MTKKAQQGQTFLRFFFISGFFVISE